MIAPAWLARLLQVDGEIEDEELAGKLAQRLRLQVPTGTEGVQVMTRFIVLGETLHRRPDELVHESLPESAEEAEVAAAQLGLRSGADLERVLRLAARELYTWLASQPPVAEKKRRPSSPGNRAPGDPGADDRLAAFAAQAIAEARGDAPPAQPPTPPPAAAAPATADARLEALAAEAIAEARGRPGPAPAPKAETPAATPPPPAAAPPARPSPPAPAPSAAPRTFGEQLEAAGPLIVFLATVGAATILALVGWLIGTATGIF